MEHIAFLKNREEIIEVFKKLQPASHPFDLSRFTFHEDDSSVSYDGDVWFGRNKLTHLPFRFRHVSGNFSLEENYLTTLLGCPRVVGKIFWCDVNNLTTINGGPKVVGDKYICHLNPLKTLLGFPEQYQSIELSFGRLPQTEIKWLEQRAVRIEPDYTDVGIYKPKILP